MLGYAGWIPCVFIVDPASSHLEESTIPGSPEPSVGTLWKPQGSCHLSERAGFSLLGGPEGLSEEMK